jgi:6-phosphogluconolactonase
MTEDRGGVNEAMATRTVRERSGRGSIGGEVVVLPTPEDLMRTGANRFVSAAAAAIEENGRFTVALSGGSTPRGVYALLATAPYVSEVDWSRIHFFWGDERCVPPGDPESNYRMAREALLDHVPVPGSNLHRIPAENDPEAAAAAYESELRGWFRTPDGPPRLTSGMRFDLVLLGMGEDGHTASLFPGSRAIRETRRWVMAEQNAEVSPARVTLTAVVINAAAEIVFLVSGREKAAMLHRVLEAPAEADPLPAQRIAPAAGRLEWLVDAEAAANLDAEGVGRYRLTREESKR